MKVFLKDVIDWKSLGLALGLLYTRLKMIENEKQGHIGECKMEMLAAWLQQQDDVPQKGVPTWPVLQAALKQIEEKQLAHRTMVSFEHNYKIIIVMLCAIINNNLFVI